MPFEPSLALAAGTAGVLMALAPTLQIRAILRRRSSNDVSIGYLAVLCLGFVTWLTYGISISNTALVVTNVSSLTICLLTIAVALRFRRVPGTAAPLHDLVADPAPASPPVSTTA